MSTPTDRTSDEFGQIPCPSCKGNGFHLVHDALSPQLGPKNLPCLECHSSGKVLEWWPDAFERLTVLSGPMLISPPDSLYRDRDPRKIRWANGSYAWTAVTHVSQGEQVDDPSCRMPDATLNGVRITFAFRTSRLTMHTAMIHMHDHTVIVGLPYTLVLRAWHRFLQHRQLRP